MNGSTKRDREKSLSRAMMVLAALVLVAGLFFQISMRAKVSAQSKEIAGVKQQIQTLNADIMNLNLCINQSHNLEAIAARNGFTITSAHSASAKPQAWIFRAKQAAS